LHTFSVFIRSLEEAQYIKASFIHIQSFEIRDILEINNQLGRWPWADAFVLLDFVGSLQQRQDCSGGGNGVRNSHTYFMLSFPVHWSEFFTNFKMYL